MNEVFSIALVIAGALFAIGLMMRVSAQISSREIRELNMLMKQHTDQLITEGNRRLESTINENRAHLVQTIKENNHDLKEYQKEGQKRIEEFMKIVGVRADQIFERVDRPGPPQNQS